MRLWCYYSDRDRSKNLLTLKIMKLTILITEQKMDRVDRIFCLDLGPIKLGSNLEPKVRTPPLIPIDQKSSHIYIYMRMVKSHKNLFKN